MHYLILHGTFGTADGNWFPWLKNELEKKGHSVTLPQMPIEDYDDMTRQGEPYTCNKQNLNNWLKYFQENVLPEIDKHSENLVIIGHSLSPLFLLHAIQNFNLKPKLAVFVAPFFELTSGFWQYDTINKDFLTQPLDFDLLKSNLKESLVFYSDNDPYVAPNVALKFAEAINAETIKVNDAGHFNTDSSYNKFELLLTKLA